MAVGGFDSSPAELESTLGSIAHLVFQECAVVIRKIEV